MLSSAKFASSASLIKKNKSFIKRLKRIGPRMDPWGTPDKSHLEYSQMVLIDP